MSNEKLANSLFLVQYYSSRMIHVEHLKNYDRWISLRELNKLISRIINCKVLFVNRVLKKKNYKFVENNKIVIYLYNILLNE